jgi:hypothetical protein
VAVFEKTHQDVEKWYVCYAARKGNAILTLGTWATNYMLHSRMWLPYTVNTGPCIACLIHHFAKWGHEPVPPDAAVERRPFSLSDAKWNVMQGLICTHRRRCVLASTETASFISLQTVQAAWCAWLSCPTTRPTITRRNNKQLEVTSPPWS